MRGGHVVWRAVSPLVRSVTHSGATSATLPSQIAARTGCGCNHDLLRCPPQQVVTAPGRWFSTSHRAQSEQRVLTSPFPSITVPGACFAEYFFERLKEYKDLPAIIDHLSGRQWTYRQVRESVVKIASGLARMGLKKGDTLLLFSCNCPEYPLIFLACAANGIILSTANPSYTAEELKRQLEMSESTAIIAGEGLVDLVNTAIASSPALTEQLKSTKIVLGSAEGYRPFSTLAEDDGKLFPENLRMRPGEDILVLPYSSGTTGLPKGVMLTHSSVLANVLQLEGEVVGERGSGRVLGVLPFYHIYGMVVSMFSSLNDGNALVVLPRFQPDNFMSAIQTHKLTVLHLVPPLVLFMAKDPSVSNYDISSLQKALSAAAPLGEGLSQEFTDRCKAHLLQMYGLTEASPVTHLNVPPVRFGTIGNLAPSTEAKVVDVESGKTLGPGEDGELYIRGPQLMKGYFKNQKATDETLVDGWLRTGDICHYDKDGFFTITDRLKELIKYKGFQVAPAELEAILLTHPAVGDAAVIGKPDEEAGELPMAFVVPKPGAGFSEEAVMDFIKEKVAPHKRLRGGVKVIDAIPKNPSGKILRRTLRQSHT